jgi:multidrug efflux system membrane fusion protein
MMKRNCWGLVAVLLASCSCTEKKAPEAGIQTVQAGTVTEIQPDEPEKYSAVVLPNSQVDLAFKSAGLIASLHQVKGADGRWRDVEVGDKVTAGTVLATVRPVDYQQRIQLGQDGVKQAQAQLDEAQVSLKDAELDYTRAKNLYASASLTKPDFDRAQAHYDSSVAQVAGAQSALASAHTQLSQANVAFEDTLLRAPLSGYVIARNVSKGSFVGNTTLGFSLIDTHVVKADFAVPDISLRGVQLGQKLALSLDALPNAASGVVTSISPQADAKSRVFSVEITLPNANAAIRPGMIGSLSLAATPQTRTRLVIPLSAVVRAPGNPKGFGVFRIEEKDGKTYASAQPIQIGETFGNAIEVTSGIAKGDRIVALGGELLQNEQQIRVLP